MSLTARVSLVARYPKALIHRSHFTVAKLFNGYREYIPFIICTRSRTGSNMLVSMLDSHPQVFVRGEIFGRMEGEDPQERLRRFFSDYPKWIRAAGFKIFYYHPLDADGDVLWQSLSEWPKLRVIHLRRRNVLRTLLSRAIAGQNDVWVVRESNQAASKLPRPAVFLDVKLLENELLQTQQWEREAVQRLKDHPVHTVFYEDLVNDQEKSYSDILRFLGLGSHSPKVGTRRQNPEPMSELIANYADVKQHFCSTEWARLLDE
jgi:LPS sulfotransferase NodH